MAIRDIFLIPPADHNEFGYLARILRSESTDFSRSLYYTAKRAVDLILAVGGLIVLSPILIIIAVAIKLTSPGPIIFKQERVGSRRRVGDGSARWETCTFTFYKFRSMRQDADPSLHRAFVEAFIDGDDERMAALNGKHNVRKLVSDPRITWVGKFLRRTSLDELPQLWNIVKGDMSLVGPRPAMPYEVEKYRAWHHLRFHAQPGLTGLWQVEARSSVEFEDMIQLDLLYVQQQSVWTDIKILYKTPSAVMRGKGAC